MKPSKISLITVVHRAYVSRLDGDSRAGVYDTSTTTVRGVRGPVSGLTMRMFAARHKSKNTRTN